MVTEEKYGMETFNWNFYHTYLFIYWLFYVFILSQTDKISVCAMELLFFFYQQIVTSFQM